MPTTAEMVLTPARPVLPCDALPSPIVAAGLRRLCSRWQNACLRLSRSSDAAELDIGFTPHGDLDIATALSFAGTGTGRVKVLYDQSGAGNHLVSLYGSSFWPLLVESGALVRLGGRPAMKQTGASAEYLGATISLGTTYSIAYTAAMLAGDGTPSRILVDHNGGNFLGWQAGEYHRTYLGSAFNMSQWNCDTAVHVMSLVASGGTVTYVGTDGVSQTIGNPAGAGAWGGIATNGSEQGQACDSRFCELVVSSQALEAPRMQAIESSMRMYWGTA